MENQVNVPPKKQPLFDGKVAGLGFVVLAVFMMVVPSFFGGSPVPYLLEGVIVVFSLIVGFVIGMKAKNRPVVSALITGIIAVVFTLFAVIPFSRVGIDAFARYALIIALPTLVAALIGSKFKKPQA